MKRKKFFNRKDMTDELSINWLVQFNENEELIKTAFSEMNSLIKGIARAQKYDLILANVLAYGTATDITSDVKKKLSLTHE